MPSWKIKLSFELESTFAAKGKRPTHLLASHKLGRGKTRNSAPAFFILKRCTVFSDVQETLIVVLKWGGGLMHGSTGMSCRGVNIFPRFSLKTEGESNT